MGQPRPPDYDPFRAANKSSTTAERSVPSRLQAEEPNCGQVPSLPTLRMAWGHEARLYSAATTAAVPGTPSLLWVPQLPLTPCPGQPLAFCSQEAGLFQGPH